MRFHPKVMKVAWEGASHALSYVSCVDCRTYHPSCSIKDVKARISGCKYQIKREFNRMKT